MAYQNFTTYTAATPPPTHPLSVSATSVYGVFYANEDAYRWKDFGAGHFTTYTWLFEMTCNSVYAGGSAVSGMGPGTATEIDDALNNDDWAGAYFYWTGSRLDIYAARFQVGSAISSVLVKSGASQATKYFVTYTKSGTGANGVSVVVTTGAHSPGGTPVGTGTFTDACASRPYIMGASTRNTAATSRWIDCTFENLNIGEGSVVPQIMLGRRMRNA